MDLPLPSARTGIELRSGWNDHRRVRQDVVECGATGTARGGRCSV